MGPVFNLVRAGLDYAESVGPDVAKAKPLCHFDGVAECSWQGDARDPFVHFIVVVVGQDEMVSTLSPTMTRSDVRLRHL